jgi:hypothetical protein
MNFKTAQAVLSTIQHGDTAELVRGDNRGRINAACNGSPFLAPDDAKKAGLKINCNLGEFPKVMQDARRQYQTAFLSRNNYFTVRVPDAPVEKALEWGTFITNRINKPLKESRAYYELHRSQWAATTAHGYAPKIWYDKTTVLPKFVALEDFRVPTDALCDGSNWIWFAVRKYYSPYELGTKLGKKGWQQKPIADILDNLTDANWEDGTIKWSDKPERMLELLKQNGGFYSSDAVPTIPLWHFYFKDEVKGKCVWKLRVVADNRSIAATEMEFLFDDGNTSYGDDLSQILHVQYGDLNNKAPFLVHSIRSLGFLMMEPIFYSNYIQCRFLQHVCEHMNVWLRVQDVQGRQRALKVDLYDKAILDPSVSVVPQAERHQINPQLVEMAIERVQDLKQSAALAYTQDMEPGRNPDETATGVMARTSAVNAMMTGLLTTAKNYEAFANREICRRLCLRNSPDPLAQKFQKACREYGIPSVYVNAELWDIEQDMPMGDGNPTMEMARANQLLQIRPMLPPTAQQEALNEIVMTYTGDPKKADRWVPTGKQNGVTDAQEHAQFSFPVLMQGLPVKPREGLSLIDQIETLIALMAGKVSQIEQTDNMGTQEQITGLQTVEQYVGGLIQQLAQDESQKPLVKQFSEALGNIVNIVKGFQQRLAQATKPPEDGGKTQATLMKAQADIQVKEAKANQQMAHKDAAFRKDETRKDAAAFAQIQRDNATHAQTLVHGEVAKAQELGHAQVEAGQDVAIKTVEHVQNMHHEREAAKQDAEIKKKQAEAAAKAKPAKESK